MVVYSTGWREVCEVWCRMSVRLGAEMRCFDVQLSAYGVHASGHQNVWRVEDSFS
jgi:hypothetical protein